LGAGEKKTYLSHHLAQTYPELRDLALAQRLRAKKAAGEPGMEAKDFGDILGEIDAEGLKKGEPKAVVKAVTAGVQVLEGVLKSANQLKSLAKLAKGLSALSFALPVASLVMDLAMGGEEAPDPAIAALGEKIDGPSTKMDEYQAENRAAFARVSSEICESAMSSQRARLQSIDGFLRDSGKRYSAVVMYQLCGAYLGDCVSAFLSIAANLPECAGKILEASVFSAGHGNLQLSAHNDPDGATEKRV